MKSKPNYKIPVTGNDQTYLTTILYSNFWLPLHKLYVRIIQRPVTTTKLV